MFLSGIAYFCRISTDRRAGRLQITNDKDDNNIHALTKGQPEPPSHEEDPDR
jgi:hypothetical protein